MNKQTLPLMAHLESLRKSLIIAGVAWLIAFIPLYSKAELLFAWIAAPMQKTLPKGSSLVFLTATEPFFTYLKLAGAAALMVAMPVILWRLWLFIASALQIERRLLGGLFIIGSCCSFATGAYLGFTYVLPLIFSVLVHFGTDVDGMAAMLSMGDYLSLAMTMLLAFGLVFELPVLMIILTRLGVTNRVWFASKRKYMLIVAFIFGGVVTPGPDIISQCSVAIPFVILYEIGILGAWFAQNPAAATATATSQE